MVFECRTCLKLSDNVHKVYSNDLPHKIETISSVEILLDYRFPSKICEDCVRNVNQMYEFRKVVQASNVILMKRCMKEQNVTTKNEENFDHEAIETKCEFKQEAVFNDREIENKIDGDDTEAPETGSETNEVFTITESTQNEAIKANFEVTEKDISYDREIEKESSDRIETLGTGRENNKIFKCNRCDFTSPDRDLYKHHRRKHTKSKKVICSICGKIFESYNLGRHYMTHTENPPVKCLICGQVCKHQESLRSHMYVHNNKPHLCTICGKVYRNRQGYNAHIKRHAAGGGKTVECLTCGKLFFNKQNLKRHMYIHTGEKPFLCKFCNKGFSSTDSRKTHERLHTKEKPFSCNFCDAAFPQKVSLQMHLKSKHADKVIVNKEIAE